jgi:predicted phosphodiesterase
MRLGKDAGPEPDGLPEWIGVEMDAVRSPLIHEARPSAPSIALHRLPGCPPAEMVVHGHSHRPGAQVVGGRLFLDPGSAGPRRFSLPRTACLAVVEERRVAVTWWGLAGGRATPHGVPLPATIQGGSQAESAGGR